MRCIIHLGLPKTGTTSIQVWLAENRAALAQAGVAYKAIHVPGLPVLESQLEVGFCQFSSIETLVPDEPTRQNYGLTDISVQNGIAAAYETVFAQAVEEARAEGCHTFVLSSEHVGAWTRNVHDARALRDWLGDHFDEVEFALYIRRQEDWVASLYSQHIKNGNTETLDDFLERVGHTRFGHKADIFAQAVGRERFHLRLMERDTLKDGDLYADIADLLGLDAADFARPAEKNPALSAPAAEFLRRMNGSFRPRVDGGTRRNPLFHGVVEHFERISGEGRKLALSDAQVARVREINAEQNEWIRATFFPDRPELFPPKPPKNDGTERGAPASVDEIAEMGIRLYRATRLGIVPPLSDEDRDAVDRRWRKAAGR